jgi:hypothetical protein
MGIRKHETMRSVLRTITGIVPVCDGRHFLLVSPIELEPRALEHLQAFRRRPSRHNRETEWKSAFLHTVMKSKTRSLT